VPKARPRLINAQAAEPCRDFLQVGGELGKADVEMLLAMIVDPTASALSDVSHTKQAGDAPSCADPRNTTPNTGMTMIITAVRPLHRILGLGFGVALAFGCSVGVGILRLPGTLAGAVGDSRLIVLFWVLGGLYAL